MKYRIYLTGVLVLVICMVIFQKCFTKDQKSEQAKEVLEIMLNAPQHQISNIYEGMFSQAANTTSNSGLQSFSEEEPREKLTQILGDSVNEHFVDTCLANNDPMSLQYFCTLNKITSRAESIDIVKTKEKNQYSYEAVLSITDSTMETSVHVNGKILFDETGKIDLITLQGRELKQLYRSVSESG